MKHLASTLAFASLCFFIYSCKTEETIPTKPNNPQTNGTGVYVGNVRLIANFEQKQKQIPPIVWSDMSGTNVEIVGTSLSAMTDKDGNFAITAVDSGVFTVKVTRTGYETVILDNQHNNGLDTSRLSIIIADTTGYAKDGIYNFIYLYEAPARCYVKNAQASGIEKIMVDTVWDHNTIKEIRADTVYTFGAEIEFAVDHPFSYTKNFLNVGYYACITQHATFDQNNLPKAVEPIISDNEWEKIGFWGNPKGYGTDQGTRKYYVVSTAAKNYNEFSIHNINSIVKQSGKNLFIHIVPIWSIYYRYILNPISPEPPTYQYNSKLIYGEVTSIPIHWL